MKLLRVVASNFKNCCDNFTIDFIAKSRKTSEDKEYELQAIADDLHAFNTVAFVGKNASGKTTAVDLLDCCYSILGDFCVENKHYRYDGIKLEIIFYHEGFIYRYRTELGSSTTLSNKASFINQTLEQKKYYKSKLKSIYMDDDFEPVSNISALPEDTSITFFVLKKKETRAIYFDCDGEGANTYQLMFKALKKYDIPLTTLSHILRIFDENIREISMKDEHNFRLKFDGDQPRDQVMSDKELLYFLSSGTTKGMLLYTFVVASLKYGFDLIIDEVEDHFHKTLVENMLSLYKDKSVNRHNATLIFTTHYCEVLDLFNRQDNIWISKANGKVSLSNMYDDYDLRPELLKSKQFYNNAFQTSVNYEDLMKLKKELMRT
jgi:AAA15 family ATPase/GTPase